MGTTPTKPVCMNCGNEHVECRQYSSWNFENQCWEVLETEMFCFECDSGPIEFVPITDVRSAALVAIKQNEVE